MEMGMDLIEIRIYRCYLEEWAKKYCESKNLEYQGFNDLFVVTNVSGVSWEDVFDYLMK